MAYYNASLGTQYRLELYIELDTSYGTGGYDIATNTSRIFKQLRAYREAGSGFSSGELTYWSWTINGELSGGSISAYNFAVNPALLIAATTQIITHDPDGSKKINVSATWNANNAPELAPGTVTGTFTLPTIPRSTQPTVSPNPVDAGSPVMIALLRASSLFTHDVTFTFGGQSGTIATGAGVSASWTPPLSLLSEIPNALSGTATITAVTKNGSTIIGTKTTTLTIAVPSSVRPDFTTVTHEETVTAIASTVGAYVQGKSKLALAITDAVGAYGSTIPLTGYRIEVASQVFLTSSATTGEILATGEVTITGTITDSRGRTGTKSVTVTVLAYAPPAIATAVIRRALAGGEPDDDGTFLRVDLTAAVQSLVVGTQKNALEYRISTKARDIPTWTVPAWVMPGGVGFASFALPAAVPVNESRDVRIEVRDALGTVSTVQGVLATSAVQMELSDAHDAAAFGQRYDASTGGSVQAADRIFQRGTRSVVDVDDFAVLVEAALDAWMPVGVPLPWFDTTPPSGYFALNGQAVSRTANPKLFAHYGTRFGAGNGSTTFNLPNLSGRGIMGYDAGQAEFNAIPKSGGAKTHVHTVTQLIAAIWVGFWKTRSGTSWTATNSGGATAPGGSSSTTTNGASIEGSTDAESSLNPYVVALWIVRAC